MTTLIIEDNDSAKNILKTLIHSFCPDLAIVGEAKSMAEGLELIQEINPELVFLDIEMPDGTGFEILRQVNNVNFKVIFTTAHEKYALQAIKFSALDYLLKPIDPEELAQAVQKAREEIQKDISGIKIKTLLRNIDSNNHKSKTIILKDKYGIQLVNIEDIIRMEAMGSYTQFFIKDQSPLLTSKVLKEYEALLPNSQFFRCHQSHLINMDYLQRYDKREGDMLIMRGGSKVPLAIRKREILLEKINAK